MLKADIHLHAKEDKYDFIKYSAKELIDKAADMHYDVLALTLHDYFYYPKDLKEYARKKGILLIPGSEITIYGRDVLVYNADAKELAKIKTFDDLRILKKKRGDNILIVAPHPYFKTRRCLNKELLKNIDIFEAIEYCHLHTKMINFNRKAEKIAKEYNKPMIGNSDSHNLYQIGLTFSYIDAKKDMRSVFAAIRKGRVKIKSTTISIWLFIRIFWWILMDGIKARKRKYFGWMSKGKDKK